MSTAVWHLSDHRAEIHWQTLTAAVNVLNPVAGLTEIGLAGRELPGMSILGVALPESTQAPARAAEIYTRGSDLVAVFSESSALQLWTMAYWRAVTMPDVDDRVSAIDLHISVQTDLLDSAPELVTTSRLPVAEAWRLADIRGADFIRLPAPPKEIVELNSGEGPACLLFRMADMPWSYAQMIHPAEFHHAALAAEAAANPLWRLSGHLFSGHIEKGVILRGRVRGAFLPRDDDLAAAARCWESFLAAELPLTT